MKLERINTFDGIMIVPKEKKDNFLFVHCAGHEDVKEADEDRLMDMLMVHGAIGVSIEDHSSVTELRKHNGKLNK